MRRIQKVVLVEPRAPGYHVYKRVRLPRLGLPLLGAILRRQGRDVTIYCEDIGPIDLEQVCRADLVGISTTTSTAPAAYRLGSLVKQRNPGATVLLGGVHATFVPEEPFDLDFCARYQIPMPVCDHVIQGEAETILPGLLESLENGVPVEPILGERLRGDFSERIDWKKTLQDLDDLPFPALDAIQGHERMKIAPIVTSRGCPFDCTFCSVIEMFSQRMRYRSIDPDDPRSVIAEMKQMHAGNWRSVFFYDDNFNAHTNRTKELLENMIRADVVPRAWTAQVRATEIVRDRELLALMRRTNCFMLYMGLESINPDTLKEYNKRQSVEQIVEAIRILREYGILAHGMFVFGADEDTMDSLRATVDFVIKNDISTVQFMILTPLPGTRYFQMLHEQGRIFDYDWSRYDAHHTVFFPRRMSPRDLQVETFRAMQRVYRMPRIAVPWLHGQWQKGFFRLYAHNLVSSHLRDTITYVRELPEKVMQAGEWKPVRAVVARNDRHAHGKGSSEGETGREEGEHAGERRAGLLSTPRE